MGAIVFHLSLQKWVFFIFYISATIRVYRIHWQLSSETMSSTSFNEYSDSNGVHTASYSSHCQFDQQPEMSQSSNPPHNPPRGYLSYDQFSNTNPELQGHDVRIDSQKCEPFWDGSKSSGACDQNESVQPVEQPQEMTGHASTTNETTKIPIVKLCLVCGDEALPTNKSVPTCYACQTFFKRRLEDKKVRVRIQAMNHRLYLLSPGLMSCRFSFPRALPSAATLVQHWVAKFTQTQPETFLDY